MGLITTTVGTADMPAHLKHLNHKEWTKMLSLLGLCFSECLWPQKPHLHRPTCHCPGESEENFRKHDWKPWDTLKMIFTEVFMKMHFISYSNTSTTTPTPLFGGAEDWTQDVKHSGQVLYPWALPAAIQTQFLPSLVSMSLQLTSVLMITS